MALGQPLNGRVDQSNSGGTVNTDTLQGSAEQQSTAIPAPGPGGTPTLQGSASSTQTRLSRPLTGQADNQSLNSGVTGNQPSLPIDFARAFPTLAPDNTPSKRLRSGSNSDLGIIGEIETTDRPHIITHVFPSSPAQEAGMMVGDVMLTADGNEGVPRYIIGVPGTPVTIVWNHRGEIRRAVLIRREAGLIPMDAQFKQEYLRGVGGFIKQFGQGW